MAKLTFCGKEPDAFSISMSAKRADTTPTTSPGKQRIRRLEEFAKHALSKRLVTTPMVRRPDT